MSVSDRIAALEARIAWLEKLAKGTTTMNDRAALDAMKQDMRKRAPALRPDAARIVAKAQAAVAKLDAALAKCAAQDGLKYAPPAHRGAQ